MNELKPCPNPWCEIINSLAVQRVNPGAFHVACECGIYGPRGDSPQDAEIAWNTRPIEDALRARVDELEGILRTISGGCAMMRNHLEEGPPLCGDPYENFRNHILDTQDAIEKRQVTLPRLGADHE